MELQKELKMQQNTIFAKPRINSASEVKFLMWWKTSIYHDADLTKLSVAQIGKMISNTWHARDQEMHDQHLRIKQLESSLKAIRDNPNTKHEVEMQLGKEVFNVLEPKVATLKPEIEDLIERARRHD